MKIVAGLGVLLCKLVPSSTAHENGSVNYVEKGYSGEGSDEEAPTVNI